MILINIYKEFVFVQENHNHHIPALQFISNCGTRMIWHVGVATE